MTPLMRVHIEPQLPDASRNFERRAHSIVVACRPPPSSGRSPKRQPELRWTN